MPLSATWPSVTCGGRRAVPLAAPGRLSRRAGWRGLLLRGLRRGVVGVLGAGLLHALQGVVGHRQHLVGELAHVFDQALAVLPEAPALRDDLLGVGIGLAAHGVGLALGTLDAALGLAAGAGGDLLGRLVGPLEDAARLLADLVERALYDALTGLGGLELGDELRDVGHVAVHDLAVVSPHHHREAGRLNAFHGAAVPRAAAAGRLPWRLSHCG